VDSCDIPLNTDIENIGIDDWAYRKGMSYGTIVVNRETGKAIDLIKSRKKEDIITWLEKHTSIKTVTRDRAKCYSASVKSVLPEAIQIADRFHLVMNYSECIYKTIKSIIPELNKTNKPNDTTVLKDNTLEKEIEGIKKLAIHTEGVVSESKRQLIKEVKKLNNENLSGRKIAKLLGIHKKTVAKYIKNEECQIITGRSPRNNYSLYLDDIIEGYCKGKYLSEIYNTIKTKGFNGSQRGLTARFSRLFKKKRGYLNEIYKSSSTEYLNISPRKLSIYLTNKNYQEILSQTEISYYDGLKKDNSKLSCLWELSIEFREVFKSKSSLNLNKWIEKIKNTSLKKLNSFANGLTEDLDAVNAAVELEANNGLTEGNVNRLKNIKRQMYGRASFNLLRRKVVLSMTE
jgi:predicted transcriptional regulator